jgi:hypothetical protein
MRKMYYDQCSKPLPDLNLGQEAYVRLKPNDNCRKGLVKQKLSDRSYVVEVGKNLYSGNREHFQHQGLKE